jgi:hypothetical protein
MLLCYTESNYFQCHRNENARSGAVTDVKRPYHRIEKGETMRDATPTLARRTDAEAAFREHTRRDALRWLSTQLRWERTLDRLRSDDEDQSAEAA